METSIEQEKIDSLSNEDLLIARCLTKNLTENELREIVFEDSVAKVVEEIKGDNRRWVTSMQTIIQLKDRYFSIYWDRALTENQEHAFYNQPTEVIREEKVITKTIVEWKVKK